MSTEIPVTKPRRQKGKMPPSQSFQLQQIDNAVFRTKRHGLAWLFSLKPCKDFARNRAADHLTPAVSGQIFLKCTLHFSCFSDSCTVHSPMKPLYIMNYNLSFLLTEIQFSQCTKAFVLYVFCMANQYNKDTDRYYLRHGVFPPCYSEMKLSAANRRTVICASPLCLCFFLVATWESARTMSDSSLLKLGT